VIGESLGSYRVTKQLGQGGMGVVYLAEHPLLGKQAAVKLLLPEFSKNTEIVRRFFNEARATTLIRHSGIVEVFDFGYHASGCAFIVMEFLEGESLAKRLERERVLSPEAVALLGRQMASAVGAAHEKGIVHRDLKPDNIYLTPQRDFPMGIRVKVLDFGIAKLAGDAAPTGSLKTRTGSVMGTPMYMSPEQCRGASQLDQRADIYSLGCILFEMACGRTPFMGEALGEIMGAHLHVEAPAPRSLNGAVPPGLDALIRRMLAKHPEQRPQTMDEVMATLEAPDNQRSLEVPPPLSASMPSTMHMSDTFAARLVPIGSATTLSSGVGEARSIAGGRGGRKVWPVLAGGGALVAAGVVALLLMRGSSSKKAALDPDSACAGKDFVACLAHADALVSGADGVAKNEARAHVLVAKACEAGSADACARAGANLLAAQGSAQDLTRAASNLKVGCDGGVLTACALLARMNLDANGVAWDRGRALSLATKACDGGVPSACAVVAELHRFGRGVGQDLKRASQLADRGCEGGDGASCRILSEMLEAGLGLPADPAKAHSSAEKAVKQLDVACKAGEARQCLDLATVQTWFVSGVADAVSAARAAQQGCDSGLAAACLLSARLLQTGIGVAPDEVRANDLRRSAASLLEASCQLGAAPACTALGRLQLDGQGVARDAAKAALTLERACSAEDGFGCQLLARLQGEQGGKGDDAYRRAATLLEPECRGGNGEACFATAQIFAEGRGFTKNAVRALALYGQGCEFGHVESCLGQAAALVGGKGVDKDLVAAKRALDRTAELMGAACTAKDLSSCDHAGKLFSVGPELVRDFDRAAGFYRTACDGGFAAGCFDLAWATANGFGVAKDSKASLALYERSCQMGSAAACNNLGWNFQHGETVKKDTARAANLYEQGCDRRHGQSCQNLAQMLEEGDGVDKDHARALELFKKACELGAKDACALLK